MSIDKAELLAALQGGEGCDSDGTGHRSGQLRGLPDAEARRGLARTYLERQHQHWPELRGTVLPSGIDEDTLTEMADSFELVYRSGEFETVGELALPPDVRIGAAYSRYSDANSNKRSLDQQLTNELAAAHREGYFIPWAYVLADAAVTGTNDLRRGYQLLKQLLGDPERSFACIFIDEVGRASRDQVEAMTLGRQVERSGKRLVGASDSFDTANAMWKQMLSVFGMLHEFFVDQLREKVDRGMNDAFDQGKHLYEPGFGYALEPLVGDDGKALESSDGKVRRRVVIVPEDAEQVRRVFRLYADDGWSPQRIARMFNQEHVDGRDKWSDSLIRQMLRRSMYSGREVWGRTTKQVDPETGRTKSVENPESQWKWRDVPHLRIIDEDLWDRAQTRMEELSRAYNPRDKSVTRGEGHPKRLVQLFCKSCGSTFWSDRGGERVIVRCNKGRDGVDGCTAKGSKTLRHIEESILNHVLGELISEEFIDSIVDAANEFLAEAAKAPKPNVKKIQRDISKKVKIRNQIVDQLDCLPESASMKSVLAKVQAMEAEIDELQTKLDLANSTGRIPKKVDRDELGGLIGSLRDLLYEDASGSAMLLVPLVGRVALEQITVEGKKRPDWFAHFSLNATPVLLEIARQKKCPSMDTWEFLSMRSWTMDRRTTVRVRNITNAERIARTVAEMVEAGSSINTAAIALEVDSSTARQSLKLWEAGNHCHLPPRDFSQRRQSETCLTEAIGPAVVKLCDEEGLSFEVIATKLDTVPATVSRAYKQAKQVEAIALAKAGMRVPHGSRLKLPREMHARIAELIETTEMSNRAIAREVGCDHHAVADARRRLSAQREVA